MAPTTVAAALETDVDGKAYCLAYPDVALAITAGDVSSPAAHWRTSGQCEIAQGTRPCSALHSGAAQALPVVVGLIARATAERQRPWSFLPADEQAVVDGFATTLFEAVYVTAFRDVRQAIAQGALASGFAHWLKYGRQEIVAKQRPVEGLVRAGTVRNLGAAAGLAAGAAGLAAGAAGFAAGAAGLAAGVSDWNTLLVQCSRDEPFEPSPSHMAGQAAAGSSSLQGNLDVGSRERLLGWARNGEHPNDPAILRIAVDGEVVGRVIANAYRPDLERNGIGSGWHAFEHVFEPPLSSLRHVVAVHREADGAALASSPLALPGAGQFDKALRDSIADALDTPAADADLQQRLEFLAQQIQRLSRRRSDLAASRTQRVAALHSRRRWVGPEAEQASALRPRALIIDQTMPDPARDAGSNAIISHAESLIRLGYDVVFAPMDMVGAGAEALDGLGIVSCHAPWFATVEEVLLYQAQCFDLVYLHRVTCALPYLSLVRRHQPNARVVYSVADLHHVRLARQAEIEDRPELLEQARRVRQQELLLAQASDVVVTHSTVEADILREALPAARVHVVPWSVTREPAPAAFADRSGFAFVGHYGHQPNVDAALWLIEDVLPLLRQLDPGIVCRLVGSGLPDILARPAPGVVPVGAVADLGSALAGVRLTVAPLQYGAGIKGKVLDSLACGVPCVCTPVAIEGLALGPGLQSLVAADAAGFARSIVRLHDDEALHAACRAEGLDYVRREFGPERVDSLLKAAVR
jgi:glycosyltransferase involved in cell wall biosynthesis